MRKIFTNAEELSNFMRNEREQALSYLCGELSCERDSIAFIIDGSDVNKDDLKIPRR